MRKHPLTDQQQAIVDAVADGKDVAVMALAGTGKTSTLAAIAEHLERIDPTARLLYLAFNKVTASEAQGRMPRNVEAITSNAMAHRAVPSWMSRRLSPRSIPARELISVLAIHGDLTVAGMSAASPFDMVRLVREAMGRWCQSSDPEPAAHHVPKPTGGGTPALRDALLRAVYVAGEKALRAGQDVQAAESEALAREWARVCARVVSLVNAWWSQATDPNGSLQVSFDQEVKFWALSGVRFDEPGSGSKTPSTIVLLDEAQDTAPVLGDLVASQAIQKVVVGDQNQQIYAWRGAVDYLNKVQVDVRLELTRSWRFGVGVANVANAFLHLLGTDERVEGLGPDTDLGPITDPDAIVVRTNGGLLEQAVALDESGKRIGVPKGMKATLTSLAETVAWMRDGMRRPSNIHEDLVEFATWDEALDEARTDPGSAVAKIVKLVERIQIGALLRLVERLVDVDPAARATSHDVLVTTAHKAKGLEWDAVRIGDDFPQPRTDDEGNVCTPSPEELRLAYVAVTRAKRALDPGSLEYALTLAPGIASLEPEPMPAPTPIRAEPAPSGPAAELLAALSRATDLGGTDLQALVEEHIRGVRQAERLAVASELAAYAETASAPGVRLASAFVRASAKMVARQAPISA